MPLGGEDLSLTYDPVWPWSISPWGTPLLLVIGLLLALLTIWTYQGTSGVSRKRLLGVLFLRLGSLCAAWMVLARPAVVARSDEHAPSTLLFLLDQSESMSTQDEFDNQSRWHASRRLLSDCQQTLQRLRDQAQVNSIFYGFAEELRELSDTTQPDGKRTDFGQALHSLYERHAHDQNLRGLIVLSDGADNGTRYQSLVEAARWRQLPCPIFPFALGKTTTGNSQRDIAIANMNAQPSSVPVRGKLAVTALVNATGFENAVVRVHLLIDEKEVTVRDVPLHQSKDNEITLLTDAPPTPGEIKVTLKIDPLPGEVTDLNNQMTTFVTVTKEGISVLLVDRPRFPEPQLICDALSQDPRIRVYTAWLRSDVSSDEMADFFQFDKQHYDVLIVGDISAKKLTAVKSDVLSRIRELVGKKGLGFMMMGGYESFGNSDWAHTPVEDILPVQIDTGGQSDDIWQLKPTEEGLNHYIMRLADNVDSNRLLWQKLPRLDGYTRLGRPKPGASILGVRQETGEPMLVSQDYGSGRTLAFAGDTTWRWQRLGQPDSAEGVQAHAHFWKQTVFWLAHRDQGEGNAWVKLDTRRIPAGGKLGFTAGLRGKGDVEASEAHFEAFVLGPKGLRIDIPTAHDTAGERGTLWKTETAGEYRLVVRGQGKDINGQPIPPSEASARFMIYEDDTELLRRAADYNFLNKLASAGGGKFHRAEELPKFLEDLNRSPLTKPKPQMESWPDWRSTGLSGFRVTLFLLFVGFLCTEWLLRRWWGMI